MRCRAQQIARVLRPGRTEQGLGRACLDDPPASHHRHPVGHARDHRKIVGDQQQPHPLVAGKSCDQAQHLGLRRDIERGRGFVGDQQFRAQRDGQSDRHPLPLPAREFVWIERERKARRRQAHPVQPFARDLQRLGAAHPAMNAQHFGHLIADRHQRVERGHRLLKDHPDPGPAHPVQRGFPQAEHLAPVEADRAADLRRLGQKADDAERGHRLARAAFAHEPKDLARCKGQGNLGQDRPRADGDREVGEGEQVHVTRPLSRGSSASRSPSPSRLSPRTVSTIAIPGNSATCGASVTIVCASASIRPQLGVGGCAPRPT